jgi:Fe-S oxidoreductase
VDGLFPSVEKATISLLRRLGHEVDFPLGQSCCGRMHVNTGYPREAVALIRNHVAAFAGYDAIVTPSGSCAGVVRHQHADVAAQYGDAALAKDAAAVAERTYELSQFLVDVLAWLPSLGLVREPVDSGILDDVSAVLTTCPVAVAETGTDSSSTPGPGREPAPSPSSRTTTWSSCAPTRWWRASRTRSPPSTRRAH